MLSAYKKLVGLPKVALAHGMAGGVSAELQRGKFWRGFVSAGFSASLASTINGIRNVAGRVMASAVAGGAATRLVGGKFSTGAWTAAFGRMFNEELVKMSVKTKIGKLLEVAANEDGKIAAALRMGDGPVKFKLDTNGRATVTVAGVRRVVDLSTQMEEFGIRASLFGARIGGDGSGDFRVNISLGRGDIMVGVKVEFNVVDVMTTGDGPLPNAARALRDQWKVIDKASGF